MDDDEWFADEFSLRENGLLMELVSRSCGLPNRPKVVESCRTGFRRIDDDDDDGDLGISGETGASFRLFFFDFKSTSSTKLNPKKVFQSRLSQLGSSVLTEWLFILCTSLFSSSAPEARFYHLLLACRRIGAARVENEPLVGLNEPRRVGAQLR